MLSKTNPISVEKQANILGHWFERQRDDLYSVLPIIVVYPPLYFRNYK